MLLTGVCAQEKNVEDENEVKINQQEHNIYPMIS